MSTEIQEKENRITDYIQSMAAIEESIEPYKEQKRALKGNYVENGWLNKEDISLAVKAYRLLRNDVDMEQLMDYYDTVKKSKKNLS